MEAENLLFIKYQIDTFIVAVFKVRKNNFRLDGLMVINVDDFIQIFLNEANRNRDRMIWQKSDKKKVEKRSKSGVSVTVSDTIHTLPNSYLLSNLTAINFLIYGDPVLIRFSN